jgi:nitrite reductase/ring-hydroxylating ferredoxin subunit
MYENDGFIPVFDDKDLKNNSFEEIEIQEIPILLIKMDGEIFAVANQCPHTGIPLSNGWRGYTIYCPRGDCNKNAFDIRTGENIVNPHSGANLIKFDCKVKDGKIWLRLAL